MLVLPDANMAPILLARSSCCGVTIGATSDFSHRYYSQRIPGTAAVSRQTAFSRQGYIRDSRCAGIWSNNRMSVVLFPGIAHKRRTGRIRENTREIGLL
jgi:hypothetical protein